MGPDKEKLKALYLKPLKLILEELTAQSLSPRTISTKHVRILAALGTISERHKSVSVYAPMIVVANYIEDLFQKKYPDGDVRSFLDELTIFSYVHRLADETSEAVYRLLPKGEELIANVCIQRESMLRLSKSPNSSRGATIQ
ncbi:MAG: hypothetical protein RI935_710 [Candidatus Parcubacteria bacterium]|jgi:hypothetical protein